ncbi:hypothetical protein [Actinomadura nitritigenes]|uniref:hypothetical protein n=1 Tax=Actinomadura nitritigenes TaxID=134602 RepID=UPI003D8EA0E5
MTPRSACAGLALALLLTGCGGHGPQAKPTPRSSAGPGASLLRLAQCARAHGLPNFPDPVQNPDGTWTFPSTAGGQRLPAACASLKAQAPHGAQPTPVSSADLAKLRQFAACLRRSGIPDWPDPDTDGSFTLPSRLEGMGKRALVAKLNPCKRYGPSGRIRFKTAPGGGQ